MKPAVSLKLDGKPFNPHPTSPAILSMQRLLDSAPKDEIYSAKELARKTGMHLSTIRHLAQEKELSRYTTTNGKMRYFGNPDAIVALRRQLEEQ